MIKVAGLICILLGFIAGACFVLGYLSPRVDHVLLHKVLYAGVISGFTGYVLLTIAHRFHTRDYF